MLGLALGVLLSAVLRLVSLGTETFKLDFVSSVALALAMFGQGVVAGYVEATYLHSKCRNGRSYRGDWRLYMLLAAAVALLGLPLRPWILGFTASSYEVVSLLLVGLPAGVASGLWTFERQTHVAFYVRTGTKRTAGRRPREYFERPSEAHAASSL